MRHDLAGYFHIAFACKSLLSNIEKLAFNWFRTVGKGHFSDVWPVLCDQPIALGTNPISCSIERTSILASLSIANSNAAYIAAPTATVMKVKASVAG
jgi:hypothetical protein